MADASKLNFLRKLSLREFSAETKATSLNVVKNPKTGKIFFSTNIAGISGKVSNKYDANKDSVLSECSDDEGEVFWMLHNPGEAVNVVATLSLV
jgi:hypothetical protein